MLYSIVVHESASSARQTASYQGSSDPIITTDFPFKPQPRPGCKKELKIFFFAKKKGSSDPIITTDFDRFSLQAPAPSWLRSIFFSQRKKFQKTDTGRFSFLFFLLPGPHRREPYTNTGRFRHSSCSPWLGLVAPFAQSEHETRGKSRRSSGHVTPATHATHATHSSGHMTPQ